MAANINDLFNEPTTTTRPSPATLTAVKANGAASLTCDSTTGWSTDTAVHFTMYEVDANNEKIANTQVDYKGIVNSSTTINNLTVTAGSDREFPIGSKIICAPTAAWGDDLVEGILVEHKQTGAHGDITTDSITINSGGSVDFSNSPLAGTDITDAVLSEIRTYTSSDTWTKPAGLKFVIVEVQGAGGGGGGAAATAAGQSAVARGGGGGGYARKKILAASLGSTETVTVGAGGTGGAAGANNGTAGGNSSFGSHATGNGGALGSAGGTGTAAAGATSGAGGTATGGDLNIDGKNGGFLIRVLNEVGFSGDGGDSFLGIGGIGRAGASDAGQAGKGYGAGGSGGLSTNGGTAQAGGNGASGVVIVYEYK